MYNSIPFFSLKRQWETLKDKIEPAVSKVLSSQQYIGGEFVVSFEKKLASYLNVSYAIGCNSGTDALWLALRALKLKRNSIVLTTPFSFIASCSEIIDHGAYPVFIDVEPDTYNISPQLLEKWLSSNAERSASQTIHKKTRMPIEGMIIVNIFGQCADFDSIRKIAKEWGLWIVEDAAQSIGSEIDGRKSGTFGDVGCFSFYPTKNLGAFGDAGAIVTNNPDLANEIIKLRHHGRVGSVGYNYVEYGVNSRLDALQAAILSEKLDFLASWNERRRAIASIYNKIFKNNSAIQTPKAKIGYHTFHQYSIVIDDYFSQNLRNELQSYLSSKNIGSNIFYPKSFREIEFLNINMDLATDCSIAKKLTQNIISLPIWPELEDDEVVYVGETINSFFEQKASNLTFEPKNDRVSALK